MGEPIAANIYMSLLKYILIRARVFEPQPNAWTFHFYTRCRFVYRFSDPERKMVNLSFEMLIHALESLITDEMQFIDENEDI